MKKKNFAVEETVFFILNCNDKDDNYIDDVIVGTVADIEYKSENVVFYYHIKATSTDDGEPIIYYTDPQDCFSSKEEALHALHERNKEKLKKLYNHRDSVLKEFNFKVEQFKNIFNCDYEQTTVTTPRILPRR